MKEVDFVMLSGGRLKAEGRADKSNGEGRELTSGVRSCLRAGIAVLTYNLMGETPEETTIVGTEGTSVILALKAQVKPYSEHFTSLRRFPSRTWGVPRSEDSTASKSRADLDGGPVVLGVRGEGILCGVRIVFDAPVRVSQVASRSTGQRTVRLR